MKKLAVILLCFALLLAACSGDTNQTTTAPDSSESAANQTTAPATTEQPTSTEAIATQATKPNEVVANDNKIPIIPLFNEQSFEQGMRLVSAVDIDKTIADVTYSTVGCFDAKTGQAIATTLIDQEAFFSVIDQTGQNIEPTNQYADIIKLRSDLYYGFGTDNVQYVFDSSGAIYGSIDDYNQPQYDALTNAIYVNNVVYLVDDEAKSLYQVDDLEAYYQEKKAILEAQYSMTYNEDKQIYSYFAGDEAASFTNYMLVDDYAIVETEESSGDQTYIRYGLLKQGGDKLLATEYYDIGHLAGEYFYVATNALADLEDSYTDFRYNDIRSYKKAIYRLDEPLTDQLYFNIEHVIDDIFHVYDGSEHFFISAESGTRLWPDVQLDGHYYFYQINDYIVALDDYNFPLSLAVIKDGKIVLRSAQREQVAAGYIETVYSGYATVDQQLPLAVLDDAAAAQNINDYYQEKYAIEEAQEVEPYYDYTLFDTFVVHKHPKLIQIQMQNYVNSYGAAHPGYSYFSDVFSAQTGQRYALADWFKKEADYRQVLADLMLQNEENMTRSLYYETTMSNQEVLEMFAFDQVDYYFTEDSLVIYYNPYNFASFADGIIEFEIGLSAISDILNDEAKTLLLE